jgi:4'-phosphopantetheinyl transferase
VRIYAARVIGSYDSRVLSLLDTQRQKKAEKLKNEGERLRSISAGLLLRRAYLEQGGEWNGIDVKTGQYGKPYIEGSKAFKYSLSHSGDYVLCAIDSDEIGADIQEMKDYRIGTAKRFFHKEEYSRINESPDTKKKGEFYKIWCAKESAVKLNGRGMGEGIDHLMTNNSYDIIDNIKTGERSYIKIYEQIEGYMVCVCSKDNNFPESLETVDIVVDWR